MIFNSIDETLTYIDNLIEKDISIYQHHLEKICALNNIKINKEVYISGDSIKPKLNSIEKLDDGISVIYEKKSWLNHIPSLYHENDFLRRFLAGIEQSHNQIENKITNMSDQFSPAKTQFVDWLSSWLGITISSEVNDLAKRKLLSDMVRLYSIRGTKQYFIDIIKHLTNVNVRIENVVEHKTLHHNLILKDSSKRFINVYIDEKISNDKIEENKKLSFIKNILDNEKPIGISYKLIYVNKDRYISKKTEQVEKQKNEQTLNNEKIEKSDTKVFEIDNQVDDYYSYDDLE